MNRLSIPEPVSAGILLTYKCSSTCKHCMYACSPSWKSDWISEEDLKKVLAQLSGKIKENVYGPKSVGVNSGLHFTGGEPFLNFNLLLQAVQMAVKHRIPSVFVETDCFWCVNEETAREKLRQLKDEGLNGILISVNPFILEQVPFEKTQRAIRVAREVFGRNLMVYQEVFYRQFERFRLKSALRFEEYLKLYADSLSFAELIPMGRVPYKLGFLYRKHPAGQFLAESCRNELTREWHVHVDNYCNYMTGYCGGISLGDARRLNTICSEGVDLEEHPVLKALANNLGELYELGVEEFGYKETSEGYISKCHLCVDVRKHIVQETDEFSELSPREFYQGLC